MNANGKGNARGADSKDELSVDELLRYGAHLKTPELGARGQLRLRNSSAVVVGLGGLGSPAALYLAAAGIGSLTLVDFDTVELGNIHRQILHWTGDVDRLKLESATEKIAGVNPLVEVNGRKERIGDCNSREIVAGHDLVIDCTDNFPARYAICDASVREGVPHVYGAVTRFEGRISFFDAAAGPCYRCLHPDAPVREGIPECAEMGVAGPVPGVVGALQAVEAIKYLSGAGETLTGRLLTIDTLSMQTRTLEIPKDPSCASCGAR
jgi:adenylyltransferase/sulfurtransferase